MGSQISSQNGHFKVLRQSLIVPFPIHSAKLYSWLFVTVHTKINLEVSRILISDEPRQISLEDCFMP